MSEQGDAWKKLRSRHSQRDSRETSRRETSRRDDSERDDSERDDSDAVGFAIRQIHSKNNRSIFFEI